MAPRRARPSPFLVAVCAASLAGVAARDASAQGAPRIMGSSVGVEAKKFTPRVLVENDPQGKVARVSFALTPRCPGDPSTAKYGSVPEVVTTTSTPHGSYRAFSAEVPDPSGGTYGAWQLRATAYDAAGTVLGRHQAVVVRSFEPRFKALKFESPTLDTTGKAGSGRLLVELDHDAALTSVGVTTSMHDNPAIGYTQLPGELAQDRAQGATPWLVSRLEQKGPQSIVGHFGFPANTPPLVLRIERMFFTDARCRTAEVTNRPTVDLAVTSSTPRAMPTDVRLDRAALAKGQLAIAFRLIGPAPRTAPAPEIGGQKAPVVTVQLFDGSTHLGSTPARPVPSSPLDEKRWDGSSMAIVPIPLPAGPTALGEALKKGLQVEVDDGGKPLAPRAVLKAP